MTTTTYPSRLARFRFRRLCVVAVMGCAATVLASAPSASASDFGYRPPCDACEASPIVSQLYLWYITHNPTIDKPRGNQAEPDGRTPPWEW